MSAQTLKAELHVWSSRDRRSQRSANPPGRVLQPISSIAFLLHARFSLWVFLFVFIEGMLGRLLAAASAPSAADEEKIPPLLPPRGPILPTFWEEYGVWLVVGAAVFVLLIGAVVWLLLRPRPPGVIPPETQARQALEQLRNQPETGTLLSRVSQIVRSYFRISFGLGDGELTTAEVCNALHAAAEPGPELKAKVCQFLRDCDERKFAPASLIHEKQVTPDQTNGFASMGAVANGLKLIDEAALCKAETRATPSGRAPAASDESSRLKSPGAGAST